MKSPDFYEKPRRKLTFIGTLLVDLFILGGVATFFYFIWKLAVKS